MTTLDRLADLLLQWEEAFEEGRKLSAEDLCWDCPELLPALRDAVAAMKRIAWMIPAGAPTATKVDLPSSNGTPPDTPLPTCTPRPPRLVAGRYRLDRLIAEGGSGQVWRGFDIDLERRVAVKTPRPGRLSGPEQVESYLAEARRSAQLRHPRIVAVYDVARHHGSCVIVSELVEGADLGRHLLSGPLAPAEAVRIAAEVAEALDYAHQQGFVHRDVKPGNILLDRKRQAFVTDFGISRTTEELRERADDGCGTLAYMSPEQTLGDGTRLDRRTDVYSLGVVLYELLTGERPFEAASPSALREQIRRRAPRPPRSLNRQLPREAERICLRCLAKTPEDRYATAAEAAKDLRRLQAQLSRRQGRKAILGILLGVTLCLATYNILSNTYRSIMAQIALGTSVNRAAGMRDAEVEKAFEMEAMGDVEAAIKHLEEALLYWKSVSVLCAKADLHRKKKEYAEALGLCEEALHAQPDYPRAHFIKGLVYEEMNQLPEALECFRRFAKHHGWHADDAVRRVQQKMKRAE